MTTDDDAAMERWLPWALRAAEDEAPLPDLSAAVVARVASRATFAVPRPAPAQWRVGHVLLAVAAACVPLAVYVLAPLATPQPAVAPGAQPQGPVEPAWITVEDGARTGTDAAVSFANLDASCTALRLRCWPADSHAAVALARVPKLTHLDLSLGNDVDRNLDAADFAVIGKLGALRELQLSGRTEIEPAWLEPLAGLPLLETLRLPQVAIGDAGAAVIAKLPSLRVLELAFDPDLTDAGFRALASMPGLRDLSLRGCGKLTAAGLEPLGKLRQLERLDLSHVCGRNFGKPRRSTAAMRAQMEMMMSAESLAAGAANGGVDDSVLAALAACTKLRELRLAGTPVTSQGLAALAKLPLRALAVTLRDRDAIAALPPTIERLEIGWSRQLDDDAIAALGKQLPQLSTLSLQQCAACSDDGLRALLAAVVMKDLDLRGCRGLTAAIVPALLEETSLVRLDVSGARWVDDDVATRLKALPAMREFVNKRGGTIVPR
jgi:hypothetical protein